MTEVHDNPTQRDHKDDSEPKLHGKALEVNNDSVEDKGRVAAPPVPRKPRKERKESQRGEAIRVNENSE